MDIPLTDGQELMVGGVAVLVLHTPGHTPGGVCFLSGRYLISGDTLFPGGPGNTATPLGNFPQIIESVSQRLLTLPDDTLVFPGHGLGTTIGASRTGAAPFASRPRPPDLCGDVLWETA